MTTTPATIPLPDAWAARVKSGLVHAVSLAHLGLTYVRGWCADSRIARVRLAAENDRLKCETRLLREELRIKDARMARIPPQERPHYAPADRLAILELKSARRWTRAEAARRLLVSGPTIGAWLERVDEAGPRALVRIGEPVNRFPDFVAHLVVRLKALCPVMGKKRIAQVLARAGLRLSAATARRMLKVRRSGPPDGDAPQGARDLRQPMGRTVTARYPDHVWNLDLTVVPTSAGFWVPWLPCFAVLQRWPLAWWLGVIIDHFSRAIVGFAVFRDKPSAADVCAMLDRAARRVGHAPRYTVSDQGPEFGGEFRDWCARHGVRPRFGAIGKHGSIAVTERAIRSIKAEGLRGVDLPLGIDEMCRRVSLYAAWYCVERPHQALGGATPFEIYFGRERAGEKRRFEPRARYPARRGDRIRGRRGAKLRLAVTCLDSEKHLPIVRVKAA